MSCLNFNCLVIVVFFHLLTINAAPVLNGTIGNLAEISKPLNDSDEVLTLVPDVAEQSVTTAPTDSVNLRNARSDESTSIESGKDKLSEITNSTGTENGSSDALSSDSSEIANESNSTIIEGIIETLASSSESPIVDVSSKATEKPSNDVKVDQVISSPASSANISIVGEAARI